MTFDANKSQAIRIGRSRRTDVCHITLNGSAICFVDEMKYLGWYGVSAKCFKISTHLMRVKFFQSFNSIYARSSHFTEPVIQHLVNALIVFYCNLCVCCTVLCLSLFCFCHHFLVN